MRKGLALLIIIFHFVAVPAMAMELLTGTVISVDREKGRLLLQHAKTKNLVTVVIRPNRLPRFLEAGSKVKIWGDYNKRDPRTFKAKEIVQDRPGWPRKDPTGVRSRLVK